VERSKKTPAQRRRGSGNDLKKLGGRRLLVEKVLERTGETQGNRSARAKACEITNAFSEVQRKKVVAMGNKVSWRALLGKKEIKKGKGLKKSQPLQNRTKKKNQGKGRAGMEGLDLRKKRMQRLHTNKNQKKKKKKKTKNSGTVGYKK